MKVLDVGSGWMYVNKGLLKNNDATEPGNPTPVFEFIYRQHPASSLSAAQLKVDVAGKVRTSR
jgi:hypothetical protein